MAQRIGLMAIANILVELNSLIMLPLLTKNLPISEYGVWVQIMVTIGLVPAIALFGLPYSMSRFLPSAKGRADAQQIFYSMAFIIFMAGLASSAAVFLLAKPLAAALFDDRVNIVQMLSLLILLECLINIPFAYFRSVQRIKKYTAFNFVKVFLSLLLVVYFVLTGWGILGAIVGLLIGDIIMFLVMALAVVVDLGASFPRFENIREYLAFGMPTVPGNLSSWIVNSSDRYVIGLLMGTSYVGYYSPGYSLGNMINIFIAPFGLILTAALSKHYDDHETDEVRIILGYSLKYFLAFAIPSAFGLSLLSRPLLEILATPEIASSGSMITPLVALSVLLLGVYAVIAQIIILEKKTMITGSIWIVAAILNLGLNLLLIPHMGILGAAVATLIAFAFVLISTVYYANKSLKIHFSLNFVLKSVMASSVMSLLLLFLSPVDTAQIFLAVASGALVYFAVLFILKGITFSEIDFFWRLLHERC